jgi:Ca-activated chloride channel homolog
LTLTGNLQPGETLTIQPSATANLVRVQRPDGATTTLNVDQPLLIYADTPMTGIYSVNVFKDGQTEPIQEELFAVNLFAPIESELGVKTPSFSNLNATAAATDEMGQREFWPWLALVALWVLTLEWYIYYRRTQTPRLAAIRRFARRS